MKIIRSILVITVITLLAYSITSCSSGEGSLPGTWITESVTAKVDSALVNLSTLENNIASTKTTKFTLNEDYTMALTIDGYETDAFWSFDSETDVVSFRIGDKDIGDPIELGKLDGGKIIYISNFKNGSITAVYSKE